MQAAGNCLQGYVSGQARTENDLNGLKSLRDMGDICIVGSIPRVNRGTESSGHPGEKHLV